MSLESIKTRLATQLGGITGLAKYYAQEPTLPPAAANCPALVLDRQSPFLVVDAETNDVLRYGWQFRALFLFKPIGLDTVDAWDDAIEPFPARLIAALASSVTGSATWQDFTAGQFDIGGVEYAGNLYFGLAWDFTIWEQVSITFGV